MENVVTLSNESIALNGFYVPQFVVKIEGEGLPGNVLRDVLQLTYKDNIKELDSFEITVNNWDTVKNRFKYIELDIEQSTEGKVPKCQWCHLFEPCNKEVEVHMGYAGNMRLMLTGNFTTMEPNFPNSGAPTLNVRGLNILHKLRTKQNSNSWGKKKDSDIVKNLEKGFKLPIKIDDKALKDEPELEYLAQRNQYDIDFIFSRARERGYVVYVNETKEKSGKAKQELYFGPSQEKGIPGQRNVTFELAWGRSLIDFKPTLTTSNQVRSVTVNGWVRSSRSPVSAKVTLDQLKEKINKDLNDFIDKCEQRDEIVEDEPVFSVKQAERRAAAILMDRHKEMVKASGSTIGLPDLRAGRKVLIKGVGKIFSGIYFVTDTTHTINDSGYITRFNARREHEEKGKQS